eukprot:263053-Amphidinium_carterae.1
MWITCGKLPMSYMQQPTDNRHRYYNFHTEVHYAITDYINVYLYNIPTEFPLTAADFTDQDHYLVIVHTTEKLLKNLKTDLEIKTARTDMAGWFNKKDMDVQYQIKAGAQLQRLGGDRDGNTIAISQYMELKLAYQQVHRQVIENMADYKQRHFHDYSVITTHENLNIDYAITMTVDIYKQYEKNVKEKKDDPQALPYKNRFFVFLLQHYRPRVRDIFQRAGAKVQDYNNAVEYFDARGGTHFYKPNTRNLDEIRRSHEEDRKRQNFDDFKQERQPVIEEEIEDFVDEDYVSDTTQTRASGSTSIKRKSDTGEMTTKKKMTTDHNYPPGVHSVIIMHQPRIANFNEAPRTSSPGSTTSQKGSTTVPSTPRAT